MARWIIAAGVVLVAVGMILHFAPWLLSWFGKLPGDIRIETDRSRVFIPITSMVLISLVLTLLINLLRR
jgi:H+/Cl- antiporter ClcA